PLCRKFPAETGSLGFAINQPADGGELQVLVAQVMVESYLIVAGPSRRFASDEIAIVRIIPTEPALRRLGRQPFFLFGRTSDIGERAVPNFSFGTFGFGHFGNALALPDLDVAPIQHLLAQLPRSEHRHM